MIQLAWRTLQFQKESAVVQWYQERVSGVNGSGKKTFVVALARKLLLALWQYAMTGEIPTGFVLRGA